MNFEFRIFEFLNFADSIREYQMMLHKYSQTHEYINQTHYHPIGQCYQIMLLSDSQSLIKNWHPYFSTGNRQSALVIHITTIIELTIMNCGYYSHLKILSKKIAIFRWPSKKEFFQKKWIYEKLVNYMTCWKKQFCMSQFQMQWSVHTQWIHHMEP